MIAKLRLLDAGLLLDMLELEAVLGQREFAFEEEGESAQKLDERGVLDKLRMGPGGCGGN